MIRLRSCGKESGPLLGFLLDFSQWMRKCFLPRRTKKAVMTIRVGFAAGSSQT